MTTVGVDVLVKLADRITAPMRSVSGSVADTARRMSKALHIPVRLDLAKAGLRDISDGMGALAARSKGLAVGLAAYTGTLAGIGVKFVGPAAEMERFTVQLTSLEGSAEGAKTAMAWISDFATRTPLALNETVAAYAKLKAFGLDPTNGSLQALVDTMAATGGGAEQLDGLAMALGQAWTKGKLQSEEALQMLERGVPVWDLLAAKMGKTSAEVQEMATAGKLGREEITLLVEALAEKNAGASEGMSKTWDGIISNIMDHWQRFQLMVMNSGVFDYLKERLQLFLDLLNQMAEDGRLQAWADMLAERILWALKAIWNFGVVLVETWQAVYPWLESAANLLGGWGRLMAVIAAATYAKTLIGIASAIGLVTKGVFLLSRALILNPIGVIIMAIAAAVYLIYQYWEPISAFFRDLWAKVTAIFSDVLDWISGINWSGLVPELSWDGFLTALDWLSWLSPLRWLEFIPGFSWSSVIDTIQNWTSFVPELSWDSFLTALDWFTWLTPMRWLKFIPGFSWSSVIDTIRDWTAFIPSFSWADVLPDWSWSDIIPFYDLGSRLFFGEATPKFDWEAEARKSAAEHSKGIDRSTLTAEQRAFLEKQDAWRAKVHGSKGPSLAIETPETLLQAANAARQLEAQFPLITAAANATLTAVQEVIAKVVALLQGTDFTAEGARIADTIAAGIRAQIGQVRAAAEEMAAAIRSALPTNAAVNVSLSGGAAAGGMVQPRASGGWFKPGWLLTGENGPELRYNTEGGFIAHNRALRGMLDMASTIGGIMAGVGGSGAGPAPALASVAAASGAALLRGPVHFAPSYTMPITVSGGADLEAVRATVQRELMAAEARAKAELRRVLHD